MQMNKLLLLFLCLLPGIANSITMADLVVVDKTKMKLYLYHQEKLLNEFSIALGASPKGHKQQQGDERTPEGRYLLDYKNSASKFYKSIHISYPNAEDKKSAAALGVDPGGDIMIHGQRNGVGWASFFMQWFDWTDGCIALSDADMDEVWDAVTVNTPIEIRP